MRYSKTLYLVSFKFESFFTLPKIAGYFDSTLRLRMYTKCWLSTSKVKAFEYSFIYWFSFCFWKLVKNHKTKL